MADFEYNRYKPMRLKLVKIPDFPYQVDPENCYIDIGLKGTNEDGLV